MTTDSSGSFVMRDATSRAWAGPCVGAQISQRLAVTCAVAFCGSIGACARKGAKYSAESFCVAFESTSAAVPSLRAFCVGGCFSSARWASRNVDESKGVAGSFHSTVTACAPCLACQYVWATTATPCGTCTTCFTPGSASAFDESNDFTVPPMVGQRTMTATSA